MTPGPHDLLQLTGLGCLDGGVPAWVQTALVRTPWVVVRRADAPARYHAVGVRGDDRSHRYPLTIAHTNVGAVLAPEDLANSDPRDRRDLPAMRALAEARTHLDECAMRWGPTGSVGFELATGVSAVTPASDLDLVVRAPLLTSAVVQRLNALHGRLQGLAARVDCQVETANGAIALAELTSCSAEVLVKTRDGPSLVPLGALMA